MKDDAELLIAYVKHGSESGFAELVERHLLSLFGSRSHGERRRPFGAGFPRRKRYEEKAAIMLEIFTSDEESISNWSALRPVLDDAMSRLSLPDRDAVVLRFFRGEELKRIGDSLGLTEDATRMRINRALEKLRGLLIARGVRLSASALGTLLSANAIQAIVHQR
jgi:RNA polymerase sigma factor (sigma-70 family)